MGSNISRPTDELDESVLRPTAHLRKQNISINNISTVPQSYPNSQDNLAASADLSPPTSSYTNTDHPLDQNPILVDTNHHHDTNGQEQITDISNLNESAAAPSQETRTTPPRKRTRSRRVSQTRHSQRILSSISCATSDSGHSGWTWSGGLFSQVEPATSSSITTITDYSTISRRSMFCQEWPDDTLCAATAASARPPSISTSTTTLINDSKPDPLPNTAAAMHDDIDPNQTFESLVLSTEEDLISTNQITQQLKQYPDRAHVILENAFTKAEQLKNDQLRENLFCVVDDWSKKTDNPTFQMWIARCQIQGWGTSADPSTGFTTLKDLAQKGSWQAFYPLALCYLNGVAVPSVSSGNTSTATSPNTEGSLSYIQTVDKIDAYRWFKAAAEIECTEETRSIVARAQCRVASMLFKGDGVIEDAENALKWFLKSAENGDKYAQYMVSMHFEYGIVVEKDVTKAKEFLLKSAEQGFADAQAALGIHYVEQEQYSEGKLWLERAVQQNNRRALLKLGVMYEIAQGVVQSNDKAITYYRQAAMLGEPRAQYILGLHYRLGTLGLQQNYQEAGNYFSQSARAGYASSQRILGLMYVQGLLSEDETRNRSRNEKIALLWFRRAAAQGDVRALGLVGACYENGYGVPVNKEIALDCYRKAARIPGPSQNAAQFALGLLLHHMGRHRDALDWFIRASGAWATQDQSARPSYRLPSRSAALMVARYQLHGWAGITKDQKSAFRILETLAKQSDQDSHAHYWLAVCYEEGIPFVCEMDRSKAYHHYLVAANLGYADAEFQVALMLANGQGVALDRSKAFYWYERSAQKGNKTALYSLGLYYLKGLEHVQKDLTRARLYFEKAARLGVPAAMSAFASLCKLAFMSNFNDLTSAQKDDLDNQRELAVYWFQKAASLGDPVAQRELGILYDAGVGVIQSYERAFDFLQKASEQNDAQATLLLGNYYQNGLAVEKDLTRAIEIYHRASELGAPVAAFAAAQVHHTLSQYEQAYTQYTKAANDPRLANTRISRTSKFMVARYILSYVPLSENSANNVEAMTSTVGHDMTKKDAFHILHSLATEDHFGLAFFWLDDLADCYRQGNGVSANITEAMRWYTVAANEAGDIEAIMTLADIYEHGKGVEMDGSLAFRYYQQGAEYGHPEAQHKLGMAYWRGLYNTPINLGDAVIWFTRSAARKHAVSHWALGQMAMENGDHDVAIAWWQKSIELGDVPSMRSLARLLLQTSHDENEQSSRLGEAMELLADAVRKGDAEALMLLGQVHQVRAINRADSDKDELKDMEEEGDDLEAVKCQEEQELATRCFQQAAAMGNVESMYLAAESWHSQQQYAAALEFYNRAADRGHLLSRVMRARYYLSGLGGVQGNPEAAHKELLECAKEKDCTAVAFNTLGQCSELGLGTPQDDQLALKWYRRSADQTQDAEAMYRIGRLFSQGRVPHNEAHNDLAAMKWFQHAIEAADHAVAHYNLGVRLSRGVDDNEGRTLVSRDPVQALAHFRKAAEQGVVDAMIELGQILLSEEEETTVDEQREGFHWLERAAQSGSRLAQRELGKLHHSGRDLTDGTWLVAQDFESAYGYFCDAAQQKDKTATLFLGIYHEHGIHVPADLELAKEWYDIAVKLGLRQGGWWLAELALAQLLHQDTESRQEAYQLFEAAYEHAPAHQKTTPAIMLSRYRLHGWGSVPVQSREAAAELIRLAEGGETKVFLEVAQCYEFGVGVETDLAKAFEWYHRVIQTQDDNDLLDEEDHEDVTEALFRLSEFYRRGSVIPVNLEEAERLYRLAENQAHR
ncbi:hypothetical protein EC973_003452 [Apophysomyces ossiformis]|uniref:HCP-like protein n=1 Tax=Apophysomyces ossiformis TaxID=679940 RepID=A0A8H7BLI2_9FUNG|nr:hypothetical protein EC973_003452 [Apophysomyces ossiformis]